MEIRSAYSPRKRFRIEFPGKGRTKQSMRDECDINLIMAKYQKTGAIAHVNSHGAKYDFATSQDFSEAMRTVTVAQDMFDHLPSSIRNRFANDPGQFLDFVQDADNREEAVKLGILRAEEVVAPLEVRVIPDPDAEPKADVDDKAGEPDTKV